MIKEAIIKKLEGEVLQAETNIKIYLSSPTQTVADHIDYTGTVEKELEKLSSAKEKLEAIKGF
jgi:predicted transcriptional regulator